MTDPLNDDIDVIETETGAEKEHGPDVGRPDYFIVDGEDVSDEAYDGFGLESGNYEMDAVEADRTLRSLSAHAHMAPAEDGGAVFFSGETFCYVNVDEINYDEGTAEVSVRKGDISELNETRLEEGSSEEVSDGFFHQVVDGVQASDEELQRQRNRLT